MASKPQKQVIGSKVQNKKKARQHNKRGPFFLRYKNEQRHDKGHIRKLMAHLVSRWGRGDLRAYDKLKGYAPILRSPLGATDDWLTEMRQLIVLHRQGT